MENTENNVEIYISQSAAAKLLNVSRQRFFSMLKSKKYGMIRRNGTKVSLEDIKNLPPRITGRPKEVGNGDTL